MCLDKLSDNQKKQLDESNRRWVDIQLSTTPMTDEERSKVAAALREMYTSVGLDGAGLRVVFVPSPFTAAIVAGAAAAVLHQQGWNRVYKSYVVPFEVCNTANAAVKYALGILYTDPDYTVDLNLHLAGVLGPTAGQHLYPMQSEVYTALPKMAVERTTELYGSACTASALLASKVEDTLEISATWVDKRVFMAMYEAINTACMDDAELAINVGPENDVNRKIINSALSAVGDSVFTRQCMMHSHNIVTGGNLFSAYGAHVSLLRDVMGLKSKAFFKGYAPFETCMELSGMRYMHNKFCIVSDRPTAIRYYMDDDEMIAHGEDGPSHQWSDGWSIWHWHGERVHPGTTTPMVIGGEE